MCLKMAAQAEDRMNLAALQQRDPYITDIVDTASQVALYSFSPKGNEWEKTSIEGTLFVYKRSASPINGFMILNRLGLNNLIEPIIKDLEFQLQDPFLLYRNTKAIFGIWFYDKDECARIGQLMNCLVQLAIEHHNAKSQHSMRQRRASESDSMQERPPDQSQYVDPQQVDIIQMLSKAQHEYVKSKGGPQIGQKPEPKPMIDNPNAAATKSTQLIRPRPVKLSPSHNIETEGDSQIGEKPEEPSGGTTPTTAISLEALFRNASINKQRIAPGSVESFTRNTDQRRERNVNRSVSLSEGNHIDVSKPPPVPLHPILQRLMSGPNLESLAQSVEAAGLNHPPGPGGDVPPPVPMRISSQQLPTASMTMTGGSGGMTLSGGSGGIDTRIPIICSESTGISSGLTVTTSAGVVGGGKTLEHNISPTQSMSFNIIKPQEKSPEILPSPDISSSTGQKSGPNKSSARNLEERIATICSTSSDTSSELLNLEPPKALLTPAEFQPSLGGLDVFQPPPAVTLPTPAFNPDVLLSPMVFTSARVSPPNLSTGETTVLSAEPSPPVSPQINPLTKQQLQQALIHLLQSDSDFITNIHEAYLNSLRASLSGGKS